MAENPGLATELGSLSISESSPSRPPPPSSSAPSAAAKGKGKPKSLTDLPDELQVAIAQSCNKQTKANLSLVSRKHHRLITPILYQSVALFINTSYAFSTDFKLATVTLCRNDRAPYVRAFNVRCEPPEGQLGSRRKQFVDSICNILLTPISQMTNLEHFEFDADTTTMSAELHMAIANIPTLKSLEIRVGPRKVKDGRFMPNRRLSSYKSLERVTLYDMSLETYECITLIRMTALKLKTLRLASTFQKRWAFRHRDLEVISILWNYVFGTSPEIERLPIKDRIPNLEELVLVEFPLPATDDATKERSSIGFTHLKKLQIMSCYQSDLVKRDFFETFKNHFTNLRELNIGGVRPSETGFGVMHLLRTGPPIERLNLFLWNMDMTKMIDAVVNCGKTLEYLVLEGDYFSKGGIYSELTVASAQKLADSCPNLVEVSLGGYVNNESAPEIARIFAQKLRKLKALRILGFNVPHWTREMNGWGKEPIKHQIDTYNLADETDSDSEALRTATSVKRKYILKKRKKKLKAKAVLRDERNEPIKKAITAALGLFHEEKNWELKYLGLNSVVARVWPEKNEIVKWGRREADEFCGDDTCKTPGCQGPLSKVAMRTWIWNAYRKIHVERSEELAGGSYKL